jgi:hypothetical protein
MAELLDVGFQFPVLSCQFAAEPNFVEWASVDYIVVNKWDSAMLGCKTKMARGLNPGAVGNSH